MRSLMEPGARSSGIAAGFLAFSRRTVGGANVARTKVAGGEALAAGFRFVEAVGVEPMRRVDPGAALLGAPCLATIGVGDDVWRDGACLASTARCS